MSHIRQPSLKESNSLFYWPVTLSETVYLKFPGRCGHCLSFPCGCDAQKADQQQNKGAFYKKLLEIWKQSSPRDFILSDWLQMFNSIYGSRIHVMTLDTIGFHFLEEAGEEAVGIRKILQLRGILAKGYSFLDHEYIRKLSTIEGLVEEYVYGDFPRQERTGKPKIDLTSRKEEFIRARIVDAKMDLIIELSDTFSWFCAILIKLEMLLKNSNFWSEKYDIELYLQNEYGPKGDSLKCPVCKQEACGCLSFHVP